MARFNKLFVKKLYMPDGKDKGQLDKLTRVTASATEVNTLDGMTASTAELNALAGAGVSAAEAAVLGGITATAAELNQTDSSVNGALMAPGAGVSAGVGTIVKYGIFNSGGIVTTRILIDITGLQSGGANDDIFGDPVGAGAKSHFGRITTAINGVIWGGDLRCFETPAGCNVDIDVNAASVDTGAQDGDVTALTNYAQLLDGGNQTASAVAQPLTAYPAANSYLYLSAGTTTDAVATAGRFLLTLYGYVA